jgi:hypothetical protein
MEPMQELVDAGQFGTAWTIICAILTLGCITVGAMLVRRARWGVGQAAALALVGPLLYGAWRYYAWMVRYDPQTGYCGLHKVSVLLVNVGVFVAVGVAGGLVARRLGNRQTDSA